MKISRRFPKRAQYLHSEDEGGDSEGEVDAIADYEGYYFLDDGVEGYCFEGADGEPVFYNCFMEDGFYFGDGEVSFEDEDVYSTIGKGFVDTIGTSVDTIPKSFHNNTVPKGFDTDTVPKGFSSVPKGFATICTSVNAIPKSFVNVPKGFATIGTSVDIIGKGFDTDIVPKGFTTIGTSVDTIGKGFDTDIAPKGFSSVPKGFATIGTSVDTIRKGFDTDAGRMVPEIDGVAGCQHGADLFADRK